MTSDRRGFLSATTALGLTGLVPVRGEPPKPGRGKEKPDEDVPASEDLMREHGVIRRILFVYDESTRRLLAGEEIPPGAWHRTATLFRRFGEEYHEKLEENLVFPEFEKRNHPLAALTRVLRKQHTAGRAVTELILRLTAPEQF